MEFPLSMFNQVWQRKKPFAENSGHTLIVLKSDTEWSVDVEVW